MPYTMEDFRRQFVMEHFAQLTPQEQRKAFERLSSEDRREVLRALPVEERREILQSLSPEERLADLSTEQIRQYLAQRAAGKPTGPRKPGKARRKK